ncbi:uncharacterized protein ACO6RY_16370 [Pungitius sinensis]
MSPILQFYAIWCATGFLAAFAQQCGQPPLAQNRIVGGQNAPLGAWPWQVDIQSRGVHVCGGSIITESWILSAAHCFPNPSDVFSYTIYAGRYQLNGFNVNQMTRSVRQVVIPPGYTEPHQGQDLALVQLSSPVTWSDYIQPVCLPDAGTLFPSDMLCYVTGWGYTQENVPLAGAGTLQEVEVPIISQSSCQSMYATNPTEPVDILSDMICAGFARGGKDSCQGDSGGPLVCSMVNGTWVQAGVVSFGVGCARPNQPGVYARVTTFSSIIVDTVPGIQLYGRADRVGGGGGAAALLAALLVLLQR